MSEVGKFTPQMLRTSFEWGLIFLDSQMRCCWPGAGGDPHKERGKREVERNKKAQCIAMVKIQVFGQLKHDLVKIKNQRVKVQTQKRR